MIKNSVFGFALLVIILSVSACNWFGDDDELDSDNAYVNNWIHENMSLWYYWLDELKDGDRQAAPDEFFRSILWSGDRFSWIQPNFMELLESLRGVNKEAGYEIKLYRESSNSSAIVGQVVYVKAMSPAEQAGLKRGDLIRKINNTALTEDNFRQLVANLRETHTLSLERYNFDAEAFEPIGDKTLQTVQFAENPNYLDTVFTINGKKIGYYVYHLFSTGPTSGSNQYNQQMDQIFDNFKSSGIDEFIIDLRFNSGGAESATINLASLIGKNVSSSDIFVKRRYNTIIQQEILNSPSLGEAFLNRPFLSKPQNIGSQLSASKVYVLTSSRTASASELLINGLRPFMDVFIIGDVTAGKNLGSISLYEDSDPRNTWGMQPIVVQSFNALNQSDYDTGFEPDFKLLDNSLVLYPFGDIRERLLSVAIEQITGTLARARIDPSEELKDVYSTINEKAYFQRNFIELQPEVKEIYFNKLS
jgi:carboxyl-terminal processing protease